MIVLEAFLAPENNNNYFIQPFVVTFKTLDLKMVNAVDFFSGLNNRISQHFATLVPKFILIFVIQNMAYT